MIRHLGYGEFDSTDIWEFSTYWKDDERRVLEKFIESAYDILFE